MMEQYNFDFNSLRVLSVVISCRSVSSAARQMRMSPSAVTYAINKIRKLTGDPVFTRTKKGMIPTALALKLNSRYLKAMQLISNGESSPVITSSTQEQTTTLVSSYPFVEAWLTDFITNRQSGQGKVAFAFHPQPFDTLQRITQLKNAKVDIDVGGKLPDNENIISRKLFDFHYKAAVRKDHPTIIDELNFNEWRRNKHLKWTLMYKDTNVQVANTYLEPAVMDINIAMSSESLLNLLLICAGSEYILLIPSYIEPFVTSALPLKVMDLPYFRKYHLKFVPSLS